MLKTLFQSIDNLNSFWDWFIRNGNIIYNFENDQDKIFALIKKELSKVHPDLVFEFSQILYDGKRQFVISADGIKENFPIVTQLISKAPVHEKWDFVAFRQPKIGCNQITYNNLNVNFDDIYFWYNKDFNQISLKFYIRGFYESPEWTGAIFVLLDTIIGEYQSEIFISSIEKELLNENEINELYHVYYLPKILNDFQSDLIN